MLYAAFFAYHIYSGYIYDWLVFSFLILGLNLRLCGSMHAFAPGVMGACACGLLFADHCDFSKGEWGSGDVVVAAAIGEIMGTWMGGLPLSRNLWLRVNSLNTVGMQKGQKEESPPCALLARACFFYYF